MNIAIMNIAMNTVTSPATKCVVKIAAASLPVLALLLQGCTTSIVVEGSVPTPLVHRIPADIGVYYPDKFKDFQHREVIKSSGTWNINLGHQNLEFFRNLMVAMFDNVEELATQVVTREAQQRLDGVLVPTIIKFGFLTPDVSGLKFYSVSIEYQLVLYDGAGEKIGEWRHVGYGKSEGGAFGADDALNRATILAIRDAGARIAIELIEQPAIKTWVGGLVRE